MDNEIDYSVDNEFMGLSFSEAATLAIQESYEDLLQFNEFMASNEAKEIHAILDNPVVKDALYEFSIGFQDKSTNDIRKKAVDVIKRELPKLLKEEFKKFMNKIFKLEQPSSTDIKGFIDGTKEDLEFGTFHYDRHLFSTLVGIFANPLWALFSTEAKFRRACIGVQASMNEKLRQSGIKNCKLIISTKLNEVDAVRGNMYLVRNKTFGKKNEDAELAEPELTPVEESALDNFQTLHEGILDSASDFVKNIIRKIKMRIHKIAFVIKTKLSQYIVKAFSKVKESDLNGAFLAITHGGQEPIMVKYFSSGSQKGKIAPFGNSIKDVLFESTRTILQNLGQTSTKNIAAGIEKLKEYNDIKVESFPMHPNMWQGLSKVVSMFDNFTSTLEKDVDTAFSRIKMQITNKSAQTNKLNKVGVIAYKILSLMAGIIYKRLSMSIVVIYKVAIKYNKFLAKQQQGAY